MPDKKNEGIPLQTRTEKIHSETFGPQELTHQTRGYLSGQELKNLKGPPLNGPYKPDGKAALTSLADTLRARLDAAELPTDQWPIIPIELDTGYYPDEHGAFQDDDLWIDFAKESTEPLTEDRIAASLLHAINRVIPLPEEELCDVFRLMEVYHLYKMVGGLNRAAMDGKIAQESRAQGPRAKRQRSQALRELIVGCAEKCWSESPGLRGKHHNTAKKIFVDVNKARLELALGSNPLSTKTISDHLRVALNESNTQK